MPAFDNVEDDDQQPLHNDARKAAVGTLTNILVRILSFFCTQISLRLMDDNVAALGRAHIRLELLLTTTLFVSREGFRLSLTRNVGDQDNWNVAWLILPVSTIAATIALAIHLGSELAQNDQDYRLGGILFALASWIEAIAEPAVLYWMRNTMDVTVRSQAEGLATLTKTFSTMLALRQWMPDWPVFAFGVAQLSYAVVYFSLLYARTWSRLTFSLQGAFHRQTCYMTILFTAQGIFKHFLTEGDRIVLSTLSGSYDQGVYAMGSAYGGLAARFLLQPLEENARLLWSRFQSTKVDSEQIKESYLVLVKLVLYIGYTFSFLAPNYTSIVLNLLAGRKWGSNVEAIAVLSAFCIYTAFLALNGMTEAFVFGVATTGREVGGVGLMHTIVGMVFAVIAPFMVTNFGTLGLVGANCITMLLRSLYSVHFAASYFAESQIEGSKPGESEISNITTRMLPHWLVTICFFLAAAATRGSLHWLKSQDAVVGSMDWFILSMFHVFVGALSYLGILTLAFYLEVEFRSSIRQLLWPTRRKEESKED